MSLINKMLIDLDARQIATSTALTADDICHDLNPVNPIDPPVPRAWRIIGPLVVLFVGLAGAAIWAEWRSRMPDPVIEPVAQRDVTPVEAQLEPIASPMASIEDAVPTDVTEIGPEIEAVSIAQVSAELPQPVLQVLEALPELVVDAVPLSVDRVRTSSDTAPVVIKKQVRIQSAEQKVENIYRSALQQYRNRDLVRAEQSLREVLSVSPGHVPARELLTGLLLEGGRSAVAVQILLEGRALTPSHYPFASMLSGIYVEQGQESAALETLLSVQMFAQTDAEYLAFLATLYQRAGQHAEAIENYRAALSYKAFENKWWLGAGISYAALHKFEAAENAFVHAQKDGNLSPELLRYAGERLREVRSRRE